MKKRLLSLFLLLTLLLTLVGCGADTVKDTTTASTAVTKTSTSASAAVSTETTTLPSEGMEDTTISATEESGGDTTAPVITPTEGDTTAPTEGVSSTVTHTTVTVPSVSQGPTAAVSTESNTTATVTTATPHPSHNVATTTTTKATTAATTLSSTKPTKPTKPSTTAAITTTTTGTVAVTTIPTTTAPTTVAPTTQTTTTTTAAPTTTASTAVSADKLLVDRAFQLGVGQKIENVTLTGVVTSSNGYSASYNNATFDLQVEGTGGTKTLYCYRVKPADTSRPEVAVGDRLSLSGTIQNYKGTIEFYPATYTHLGGGGTTATTTTATTRPTGSSATIDEDGIYDSKEDVGLYIHLYGKLPKNYVTKSQYNKDRYLCVGGDRFYNKEGRLPGGETYYECDIDTYGSTSRGAKRLVWTKSGIVYYTGDHYETFIQLYGER